MENLYRKVDEMDFDGLVTGLTPTVQVRGGTICKGSVAATFPRGAVLAKSSKDGKLYLLGTAATSGDTLTPDCILCDDSDVGTDADAVVTVYTAGCFDPNKVTVKNGYTMTEADRDKLRERGIVFLAATE